MRSKPNLFIATRSKTLLVWVLIGTMTLLMALPVMAENPTATQVRSYDIAPGPLGRVLSDFADTSGLLLSADAALTDGKRSAGLEGRMTATQALDQLTAGSGLRYRFTNDTTVTLERNTAQDEDGPIRLGPVTVTAARTARPVSEVAASVTILDREDIERQPTFERSPLEALGKVVPGAQITGFSGTTQRIRGRPVSYRVNGVEISRPLQAVSASSTQDFAPGAFDRIEAIRGTDATFYNSGATGGAYNFQTGRPEPGPLQLTTDLIFMAQPTDIGESFSPRLRQTATGSKGSFEYFVQGAVGFFGTQFGASGDPLPTTNASGFRDSTNYDINASLAYRIDDDQRLETTQYFIYTDIEEKFQVGASDADPANDDSATIVEIDPPRDRHRRMYVGTLSYSHSDLLGNRVNLRVYGQDRDGVQGQLLGGPLEGGENRIGVNFSASTPFGILENTVLAGSSLEWGADYQVSTAEAFTFNGLTLDPGADVRDVAGFAQLRLPIAGAFLLTGGVRYTATDIDVESTPAPRAFGNPEFPGGEYQYDQSLFNAGLTYFLSDRSEIYASFTQALDVTDILRATRLVTDPEQIKPEPAVTDQYEIGFRGDFGRLRTTLSAFYSESELGQGFRLITTPDSSESSVTVREPREIWGVELTADAGLAKWLDVGGSFAFSRGTRENDEGDTVQLTPIDITQPTLTGYVDVSPIDGLIARIQVTHRFAADAEREARNNFDGSRVPALTLVDFYASYETAIGEFSLGIDNLLNEKYFEPRRYVVNDSRAVFEPGRSIMLGYSMRW